MILIVGEGGWGGGEDGHHGNPGFLRLWDQSKVQGKKVGFRVRTNIVRLSDLGRGT